MNAAGAARPDAIDRNATSQFQQIEVLPGAALRGTTTDWAYTVPTNKKARAFVHASCSNELNVALNGTAHARILVLQGGVTVCALRAALMPGQGGAINDRSDNLPDVLLSGGQLKGETESNNNAAGSNVRLRADAIILEYDQ